MLGPSAWPDVGGVDIVERQIWSMGEGIEVPKLERRSSITMLLGITGTYNGGRIWVNGSWS